MLPGSLLVSLIRSAVLPAGAFQHAAWSENGPRVNTVFSGDVAWLFPTAVSFTRSVSSTLPGRTSPAVAPPASAFAVPAVVADLAFGTVASLDSLICLPVRVLFLTFLPVIVLVLMFLPLIFTAA